MSLKNSTKKYTDDYYVKIEKLYQAITEAEAIVIGAGAGLSTAAGFNYKGKRFEENFSDFAQKYGIKDIYSGGFYKFATLEEYWAWWSRSIYLNRYVQAEKPIFAQLLALLKGKNYFVITTNVDHQFQIAGFPKNRLYYMQGDFGLWQCSKPCSQITYDNEETVMKMLAEQKDMKIPSELIPYCPVCGAPLTMNLRVDNTFVQDEGWYKAKERYDRFIYDNKDRHTLFWEIGVGDNTPMIIKYSFWQFVGNNPQATYASVNLQNAFLPEFLEDQEIYIKADAAQVIEDLFDLAQNEEKKTDFGQ